MVSNNSSGAFRLGDVRGIYPTEVNEAFAYRFALAFAERFALQGTVATGRDMRASSEPLQEALNNGFRDAGLNVADLGLCTTELGYFASTRDEFSSAVIVTASHNPPEYNGFKCVLSGGEAVTFETGLKDVEARLLEDSNLARSSSRGQVAPRDLRDEYISLISSQVADAGFFDLPVALNGLNGTAVTVGADLAESLAIPVNWFRAEPGPIPDEGADPTHPQLAAEMKSFMQRGEHALGVAWDGDCDRCVFFDSEGNLVPAYYIVGLLAGQALRQQPGAAIVFDTKLAWNTLDVIRAGGGVAVPSETGHAFMKRRMRESGGIYGGELSSHHYFGSFFGCDSGMLAWLRVLEILSNSGRTLADLVAEHRHNVRCTPEISVALTDARRAMDEIVREYQEKAVSSSMFDGPSFEMPGGWRFSLRYSKTEPLVRLNFECRGDTDHMLAGAAEVLQKLEAFRQGNRDWQTRVRIQ